MFDLVEMQSGREPLLPEAQRLVRIQREIAHFAGEHYLLLWLYQPIRDHVMNGAQCFIQRPYARSFDNNRRDYFQLIHGSSASVKPLACGGNKPHVQWSTEVGVTCPRSLRMVKSDPAMRTLLAWSRHPFW